MARWMIVGVVAAMGCAGVRANTPMMKLPEGLEWCTGRPEPLVSRPGTVASSRDSGFFVDEFKACLPALKNEDSASILDLGDENTIVFGLTTDDRARITAVCLAGGNFGEPTHFTQCLAERIKQSKQLLDRNLDKKRFAISYLVD